MRQHHDTRCPATPLWNNSMPKLELTSLPTRIGSNYPAPFDALCAGRARTTLGTAGGLTDFGINLTQLPPGSGSSQRHWHSEEDECLYVLSGELVLITDAGEQLLQAGDCAAFPKNLPDGHQLINRSSAVASYLEIGSRSKTDVCSYPDIDLHGDANGEYAHKDGSPYRR